MAAKLYPHLSRPHLRRVRLHDGASVAQKPTWLQLASTGQYDTGNVAHMATLAVRMGCDVVTAKRLLTSAYRTVGNPDRRVAGALRLACETVEVRTHNVRVPDADHSKPERFTSEFQNGRRMGLITPPTSAELRRMAKERVVDDGDSLRGEILQREAAEGQRDLQDPTWFQLPKSFVKQMGAERLDITMRITTDGETGAVVSRLEAA